MNKHKEIIQYLNKRIAINERSKNRMASVLIISTVTVMIMLTIMITSIATNIKASYAAEGKELVGVEYQLVGLAPWVAVSISGVLGFLMIYSYFSLSREKDTRFYTKLLMVGATKKQLVHMVIRQFFKKIFLNLFLGVVAGTTLCLGLRFFMKNLLRMHLEISWDVKYYLIIIGFAFAFVFFNMMLSVLTLDETTPKATIGSTESTKWYQRKSKSGGKIPVMALKQLFSRLPQTIFYAVCIACCFVGINLLINIFIEISPEKWAELYMKSDVMIGTEGYFDGIVYAPSDMEKYNPYENFDCSVIRKVKESKYFQAGGAVYFNFDYNTVSDKDGKKVISDAALKEDKNTLRYTEKYEDNVFDFAFAEKDCNGNYQMALYGADDYILSKLEVLEGEIDLDKLATGKYIIYCAQSSWGLYDFVPEDANTLDFYHVGDTVTVAYDNSATEKEYTVLAVCKANLNTEIRFSVKNMFRNVIFYLPASEYGEHIISKKCINFSADAVPGYGNRFLSEVKSILKNYNAGIKKEIIKAELTTETKESVKNKVYNDQTIQSVIFLGMFLLLVFGALGIAGRVIAKVSDSLVNAQEYAVLECIGMTRKQFYKRFLMEELYFILILTVLTFGGISVVNSIFNPLLEQSGMLKYWSGFKSETVVLIVLLIVLFISEVFISIVFF
ncbi:ABC transporter permease family protein [Anaerosacchariphilus polymeriproducens]|uniref:ABC transporter permease n=1 Tax=Anaerosacchariphilus polymeriproducens TaxID=1812858 RepID=A0A371ASE0_9FIRM|nr:FtsX-like permease family protein [Anaerosacchariphilus polymeriproducens]RDU22481.1 ABC transporter permease [Anaerosacchariphilus polymeriproducens]